MEVKEQPNQNPDQESNSTIQEEKPTTVAVTIENEETSRESEPVANLQISDTEKSNIVDMMQSQVSKDETADELKHEGTLQISDTEKSSIVDMMQNQVSKAETADEPKHEGTPQITDSEKSSIVEMIQGKTSDIDSGDEQESTSEMTVISENEDVVAEEKETRQISNTERLSIIYLLRGKIESEEHEIVHADIDFDQLNKQELVDILEEIVQEKDISIIKSQVAKINSVFYQCNKKEKETELRNFISSGGKEEDFKHIQDPLEIRYNAAIGIYKHNKSKFSQDLEKQKHVNIKLKYELLEELKELINSEETLKKTYDEFKILQDKWKEIGMVPASELRNLWQSYHFLVEKFFDKVRINRELRDLDLKKNLEAKIALCEKAEELIVEKSILKSFKLLQHYHDKWREIGPVPIAVKEDVWERFKGITDKINLRRKEYYKELQDQQQANYEAKFALCDKAQELVAESADTLKSWQSATDKVNELLKVWKTIGRAPKAKNDEIWARFKGYLDSFFKAKREYLGELKGQQVNNYNLKLDLCAKAESIMESNDWGNTTRELINLQKEWKIIGPVPRKYSDKVWKRFRGSCDTFFSRKSDHFKNIHAVEHDNYKLKKDLVASIAGYKVDKDKSANLGALKEFQRKWIEIGHVPFKEKEIIHSKYRAAIDELINKMDVNKAEISAADFENKLEILKSGPEAGKMISKERMFISGKIRKIKEDLAVWENNIGFFSNSKQSNKLKEEFEHKINRARSEIESMKAKLKMLNS